MKRLVMTILIILVVWGTLMAASTPQQRFDEALSVIGELTQMPDAGAFTELLGKAKGIVFYPSMVKAGLIVGAQFGYGFMLRRDATTGEWYGPLFLRMYGLSYGFQAGVQTTGLVFIIVNETGFKGFTQDNFTLGGSVSLAAGPIGRRLSADTDYLLRAAIYSYAVSKGFFAGLSMDGAIVVQDEITNVRYFDQYLTPDEIINTRKVSDAQLLKLTDLIDELIAAQM